jgi:hypothetical protein
MTISTEVRKAGPFTGNGVTTAFPFAFKVFQTVDVLVVQATAAGVETELVLNTHYTITLNSDQNTSPGGTVNMVTAPPVDYKLVITSQVEELQPVDITNGGGFYPAVINSALDRLTILVQQLKEQVNRSVKSPITSEATETTDALIAVLNELAADADTSKNAAAASAVAAAASETAAEAAAATLVILGTVSQSGGVPTGAVMQNLDVLATSSVDTHSGGKCVRFAGGLQICWSQSALTRTITNASGSLYTSAAQTFNFPATFAAAPIVTPIAMNATGAVVWAAGNDPTTTAASNLYLMSVSNTATARIAYIAVGRWF